MISIVIPTMNRSDFLARLLTYYADNRYDHWIIIGDSSAGIHLERNRVLVESMKHERAISIVKEAFRAYLSKALYIRNHVSKKLSLMMPWKIKMFIKKNLMRFGVGDGLSLPMVNDPSSPYHRDFQAVFRAINTPLKDFVL